MIRFIKELLAGNVVHGGAGGAYPGADGQHGKAYGPGAIAGRGGKGGRFGRGGDGGNAAVIGKGRAVGGAGGDVVESSIGPQEIQVRLTSHIAMPEFKGEIYLPREPGVYDLHIDETGFYALLHEPMPEGQIDAAVRRVVSGAEGGAA